MDHAELIVRLGDYRAVAEMCGKDETTVFHWKTRGIPLLEWDRMVSIAAQHGIVVSRTDLRDHAKQKTYRAA